MSWLKTSLLAIFPAGLVRCDTYAFVCVRDYNSSICSSGYKCSILLFTLHNDECCCRPFSFTMFRATYLIPWMHLFGTEYVENFLNQQIRNCRAKKKSATFNTLLFCGAYFLNHVFSTGDYLPMLTPASHGSFQCLHQQNSRIFASMSIMRRVNLVNAIAKRFHFKHRVNASASNSREFDVHDLLVLHFTFFVRSMQLQQNGKDMGSFWLRSTSK